MQPLYVLPSDGVDHGLARDGTLDRSIAAMQRWFAGQADGSRFRLAPEAVRLVRLRESDADIAATGVYVRDRVEQLLTEMGYNDQRRVYAVWYDGTSHVSCGGGAWPPDLIGHVAALYLQGRYGDVDCSKDRFSADGVQMENHDFGMLHEILHTLGYVPKCAPHSHRGGHSSDGPQDLMWAGDAAWQPSVLDVGRDDYYKAGIPGCPDLSRSAALEPLPERAEMPPGW